jgi:hypothetical protein
VTNTGSSGWTTREGAVVTRLQNLTGRTVTVIDDGAVPSNGLSGYDLIIVTRNASASTLGTRLTNSTAPVLSWNGTYYAKLKLATSGSETKDTRLVINLANHPAVTGVGTNPVIVDTSSTLGYGTPPATALRLARLSTSTTRWAIFAVPAGGKLTDNSNAPGCRIGFAAPADWRVVLASGWQLLDQTVTWALGGCG